MQSIDSIERYAYGTSKDLKSEKEQIKCNNIIKQYKNDELWWYWPQIPYHPYRIFLIGGSGFAKTSSLFNLISREPDIDNM